MQRAMPRLRILSSWTPQPPADEGAVIVVLGRRGTALIRFGDMVYRSIAQEMEC